MIEQPVAPSAPRNPLLLPARLASRPPLRAGRTAWLPGSGGGLRCRRRGDLRCHTVEPTGLAPFLSGGRGSSGLGSLAGALHQQAAQAAAANGASPTETFQQLRQAALTSLDFAYESVDESSDFDDSNYDAAEPDVLAVDHGPIAVAGRAIYEVRWCNWVRGLWLAGNMREWQRGGLATDLAVLGEEGCLGTREMLGGKRIMGFSGACPEWRRFKLARVP